MNETMVIEIGRETVKTILLVAMPLLGAGLIVGLLISVFQVATSIQDATLTFIPKIVAVLVTLLFTLHWMMRLVVRFTLFIFDLVQSGEI